MFGNKKSFNEGMKSGIRLSEEIVKRDTRAVNKIYEMLESMPGDMRELKESFEEVIKSLENTEIEKLFGIVRTSSPNDLEEEENSKPFSIEAEEALLGSIFINPNVIGDVVDIVTSEDFYKNNYKLIFSEIRSLIYAIQLRTTACLSLYLFLSTSKQ